MRILVAPDSFGGTLTATEAAAAIATGWRRARPQDEITTVPLSDGGEGLLEVVARDDDERHELEVVGPHGHPTTASLLIQSDGTAVIESAVACGLHLLAPEQRVPELATTYGVGQLLVAARGFGVRRVVVGLGGSASVDGGAGALLGLGYRLTVADGSGLKIGAAELPQLTTAAPSWAPDLRATEVVLLADVDTELADAARVFGPQKGATAADIPRLEAGLGKLAEVLQRDLGVDPTLRHASGSGAAGGLGYGLAAVGGRLTPGAAAVRELVGLDAHLAAADLVVTGEGRLDATTGRGKVVGQLLAACAERGLPLAAVVGTQRERLPGLVVVAEAAPDGPGADPAAEVAAAAARMAADAARSTSSA